MDYSREISEAIKVWLAGGGVVLVLLWTRIPRHIAKRALIALVLVSGLNYIRVGPSVPFRDVDSYDVIHYYLSAKYFDEVGYYDLYPALLLVDAENGPHEPKLRRYRAQDAESGYRPDRPVEEGIARGREVREEKFTPERWKQFEHDFLYLQRGERPRMGRKLWAEMMNDRGFNGTPVWLMVARPIALVFPVEAIKLLGYIDVLLLGLALFALRWAYGGVTALFALLFLFLTYSLRWPVPSWAFLRYDWISGLLVAMALLKKRPFADKWPEAWAGALVAYAALVRVFPAVWMFGPAMKGVFGLLDNTRPLQARFDLRLLKLAAGFVAAVLVLEGSALAIYGVETAKTHAGNIAHHVKPEELSSRRTGFALGYVYDGKRTPKHLPQARKVAVKETANERLVISALLLLALGFGLRKKDDDETLAYGFVPFFMLATASYYYMVARITLIAIHAANIDKLRHRVGLAFLIAVELMTNWMETQYPGHRVYLIGHLSWALTLYAMGMTTWIVKESLPPRQRADAASP